MIKLINPLTGTDTWVHESRLEEYKARGFKLYAAPEPPKPKRSTRKKPDPKAEK